MQGVFEHSLCSALHMADVPDILASTACEILVCIIPGSFLVIHDKVDGLVIFVSALLERLDGASRFDVGAIRRCGCGVIQAFILLSVECSFS